MQPRYMLTPRGAVVFDAALIERPDPAIFSPEHWRGRGALTAETAGRGTVHFLDVPGGQWVLRHYRRGGWIARISDDRYVWPGLSRTRVWREWHLLHDLHAAGYPVPRPVAGRVERTGPFYRGDIITERVPGEPLSALLAAGPIATGWWQAIGDRIRRFHDAGVHHADLNAHNILLAEPAAVCVLDFDRGRRRNPRGRWRTGNLRRLRRSLDKLAAAEPGFRFEERDWQALLAGYGNASRH